MSRFFITSNFSLVKFVNVKIIINTFQFFSKFAHGI